MYPVIKFGPLLTRARKKANMTQKQLADKLGIPTQNINRYETTDKFPRIDTVVNIALALGTDLNTLMDFHPLEEDPYAHYKSLLDQDACFFKVKEGLWIAGNKNERLVLHITDEQALQLAAEAEKFAREILDNQLNEVFSRKLRDAALAEILRQQYEALKAAGKLPSEPTDEELARWAEEDPYN